MMGEGVSKGNGGELIRPVRRLRDSIVRPLHNDKRTAALAPGLARQDESTEAERVLQK
jgi:hypothetical protein